MKFFRQLSSRSLLLWSIFLSIALLCSQGLKLHLHGLDDHNEHWTNIQLLDTSVDHSHTINAHFSYDISHSDHHDESVSEIDINPDGLMKNSNSFLAIALLFFFFAVSAVVFSRKLKFRQENKFLPTRHYHISPPLRAPPQY